MTKAITYNNAGIVEAIKRNSGSTKFYKPSYQGIIEAIQDWSGGGSGDGGSGSGGGDSNTGGGGTNVLPEGGNLPDTGNTEGDLVVIPNGDGDYFMYVFANGSWERLHITTEEVETAGAAPFSLVTDDGVTVRNQKEINAYLADRITALSEKGYDDTEIKADLAQEIIDRIEGDQALQNQIDALEAYDDTDIKADLAEEIRDREAGDADLQEQIDALEAYNDTAILNRLDNIDADQASQDSAIANEAAINATQSDQINLIETQIQLLAKAQAVGKWQYVRNISGSSIRPPAATTFYGTHQTSADTVLRDWSDLRLLMVDKTDLEGTEYAFTNFEEGDKIEILDTDGSSACYGTLTNHPSQETYGNMIIAVERSNGGPRDDKEYILSVYRPGAVSGDVDLDILDGRYLVKTGDTMTGNLTLSGGGLYTDSIIKSTRDTGYAFQVRPNDGDATAFIHTNGNAEFAKVTVEDAPASGTDLANKSYVDTKVGDYLPLTGGEMTGLIEVDRSSGAGLQLFKEGTSNLIAWVDGGITTTKTTFNDDQLVTKAYVDNEIAENTNDVSLDGYLQKSGGTMTGDAYIRFSSGGLNFKKPDGSTKSYFYNASDTTTQLTSYNGTTIKVTARDGEPGGGRTFIDIKNADNDGVGGDDSGYRMKLYHVADPTGDLHAANRRYVDARTSPTFRWKCVADAGAENLTAGEFFINSDGHFYLHPVTHDGVDLSVNSSAGSINGMNFRQLATVHAENGNSKYMCTWSEMKFNNASNKYIKIFMHSAYLNNTTSVGTIYHLNIPGFTF